MPIWIQNILVLAAVGGSILFLTRRGWATIAGRRSKLGSCCAKGCGAESEKPKSGQQVQFIPVEMLGRKK